MDARQALNAIATGKQMKLIQAQRAAAAAAAAANVAARPDRTAGKPALDRKK